MNMKVLIILISEGWGGAERVVYELASHLKKNNIDVSLVINHEIRSYFTELEVEKHELGSLFDIKSLIKMIINPNNVYYANKSKPIPILNLLLILVFFHRIRKKLGCLIKKEDVNIIHSHLEYADLLTYLTRKQISNHHKWVQSLHGHWFSLLQKKSALIFLENYFSRYFLLKLFQKADKIVFVSRYLSGKFKRCLEISHLKQEIIIPNGINLSELENTPLMPEKKNKKFKIFFPGGDKFTKGGDILIDALKIVEEDVDHLELHIALDVKRSSFIRKSIEGTNLESKIFFKGFLEKKEYFKELKTSNILAMPSRMEAFGLVYLDAMAMGIPIIASKTTGAAEVVKDRRNGILVNPDAQEVADAILKLYQDPELCKKIYEHNLEDVNNFDWDHLITEYIKLYGNIQ